MEFNYVNFQPSDLDRMNTERDPEIYGSILQMLNGKPYLHMEGVEYLSMFMNQMI